MFIQTMKSNFELPWTLTLDIAYGNGMQTANQYYNRLLIRYFLTTYGNISNKCLKPMQKPTIISTAQLTGFKR